MRLIMPELLFMAHHDTAVQKRIITSSLSNKQLGTATGHGLNIGSYSAEQNSAMSPLYLARAASLQRVFLWAAVAVQLGIVYTLAVQTVW